jgi:hypothetical protein
MRRARPLLPDIAVGPKGSRQESLEPEVRFVMSGWNYTPVGMKNQQLKSGRLIQKECALDLSIELPEYYAEN